jgi:hypothetical protein
VKYRSDSLHSVFVLVGIAILLGSLGSASGKDSLDDALQRAFELRVLETGVDKDGCSFLRLRLTYLRRRAHSSNDLLPAVIALRDDRLPWSRSVFRRTQIRDAHGTARTLGEFQSQLNGALFDSHTMTLIKDGESLEGELRFSPVRTGEDGKSRRVPPPVESREVRLMVHLPCHSALDRGHTHDHQRAMGFVDVTSSWKRVPANWAKHWFVEAVGEKEKKR